MLTEASTKTQGETTKADYKRNFTLAITSLQEALPKTIISIIGWSRKVILIDKINSGLANMDFLFNAASIIRGSVLPFFSIFIRLCFRTKYRPCKNIDFQLLAQRRIDQYREVIF